MRRKLTFALLLLTFNFGLVTAVHGQGGFTTVTGTITDPNGLKYSCATISAQLITAGGPAPTLNGGGFTTVSSPVGLGCPTIPGTGAPGSFMFRLADSGVIVPSNTTWRFTINTTGIAPPAGTGPQSFSVTTAINCSTNTPAVCTSNTIDISALLSSSAPALSNGGGGSANINLVQTPGNFANFASATNWHQAFTSPNTGGNLLVLLLQNSVGTSGNTCTPSSTDGDVWFQAGGSDIGIATIFYAIAKGGSINTVTCTMSAASSGGMTIAEYSGVYTPHPVSQSISPNWTIHVPLTMNIPVAGSLTVVLFASNGSSVNYSSPAGCNFETPAVGVPAIFCDNTSTPAGLQSFDGNQSPFDQIAKVVSFLPATYGSGTLPTLVKTTEGGSNNANGGMFTGVGTSPGTDVFAGGNLVGDTLACAIAEQGGSTTNNVTGVTDTRGDTFTLQAGALDKPDNGNHRFYQTWTAPISGSPSLTNNTISIAFSAGSITYGCGEFSGVLNTQDTNANGNTLYTITAAQANELIFTVGGFTTGGTNFSNLSGTLLYPGNGLTNQTTVVQFQTSKAGSNTVTLSCSGAGCTFPGNYSVALNAGTLPR